MIIAYCTFISINNSILLTEIYKMIDNIEHKSVTMISQNDKIYKKTIIT
jgi:hypothetical protein